MIRLFSLLFFSLYFLVASGQQATLLDSMVNMYARHKGFNGSVLVAQKGNILLQKGYGYKDVAKKTRVDENSLYQYGSVTKQFTAALVMHLQEKGKLNIQDRLSKYFPQLPFADSITIFNLLTHTSGIFNYTNDSGFMASDAVKPASQQKILALFSNKPLEFVPGSKFNYSNSGYMLLGYIIEKASGMPYEKLMRQVILQPLNMKTAGFDFSHNQSSDRTTGYYFIKAEKFQVAGIVDSSVAYAAGSLYGGIKDLYAWHQALQKKQLLSANSWQQVYTPLHAKYAFGWQIDTLFGKQVAEHGGGIFGYTSMFKRFPEEDVVIIILSNNTYPKDGELARNLSALVFNQPAKWPTERIYVQVPEEKLKPYVGQYELNPNFIVTIILENGVLIGHPAGQNKTDLRPQGENNFYVEEADAQVSFEKDASGMVTGLKLIQGGKTMIAKKIK